MSEFLLFAAFPYIAIILAVVAAFYRYFTDRFSFSSLSSQFLENRQLFWGSVPFHYGIIIILTAHLLAALFPSVWATLIGEPLRLYILELTGLALGIFAAVGMGLLIIRRAANSRLRIVTSGMDWLLLAILLLQVATGVYVALFLRWGSAWYLQTAVPWLWSLFSLDPQIQYVTTLPLIAQLHMLSAFLLLMLLPFTRLVHLFTIPITYLWRPYQVVIWNRRGHQSVGEKER